MSTLGLRSTKMCTGLYKTMSSLNVGGITRTHILGDNAIKIPSVTQVNHFNIRKVKGKRPDPHKIPSLRTKVHLPEDGIYTIDLLPQTKLGGRDPETNRIIHGRLGGGSKRLHRWVDYYREGPKVEGEYLYERIIKIMRDPNRSANIALVNHGERLRYIIATTSMKEGQLIRNTSYIPRIPVLPVEGDAYPVGALALGTKICCVSKYPGAPGILAMHAGMTATLKKKVGDDYILEMPDKRVSLLHPECMCVVGQISNPEHSSIPIGSPNRLRWLGWRPRSGLWQRKTGYHGRKIRPIPPAKHFHEEKPPPRTIRLNLNTEQPPYKVIQCTLRVT